MTRITCEICAAKDVRIAALEEHRDLLKDQVKILREIIDIKSGRPSQGDNQQV